MHKTGLQGNLQLEGYASCIMAIELKGLHLEGTLRFYMFFVRFRSKKNTRPTVHQENFSGQKRQLSKCFEASQV